MLKLKIDPLQVKAILVLFIFALFGRIVYGQNNEVADSLISALKVESNIPEKIELLNRLGHHFHQAENYSKALKYKVRELQILNETGQDSLAARAKEKIGVIFYRTGSYDVAAEYYLEALNYFEKKNNQLLTAQTMGNLANVYTRIGNYSRAIEYLNRSKVIYKQIDVPKSTLVGLYVNIGLAYAGHKDFNEAMNYYEKALKLVRNTSNNLYKASVHNNMGEVYFELKKFNDADSHYNIALDFFKKSNNKSGIGTALSNLAKVAIENGSYEKAIELATKALHYFESINAKFFIADVEKQLTEAYKRKRDFEQSLKHMERYMQQLEEVKGAEITERIAGIELQNKMRKEEQKLKLIKQQSELKEKESKLSKIKLYITIFGILILLIVTVLIMFNQRGRLQRNTLKQQILQREQDQLHNELAFKRREIENFAIHINEKNELLKNLNKAIKKVAQNNDIEYNDLHAIKNLVNQSLYIDNNRKELELKINQAQQEFLHRLKSHYQHLTKTDLRLCSFILLEFSTKEIATFMNIEPSSVKMSRNRLRKKLSLPPKADIKEFLDSL